MGEEVNLTIMFADVCGSTSLYESSGDLQAKQLIDGCVNAMSEITAKHGGTVIKTIGDEVMATFDSADSALQAAAEMSSETNRQFHCPTGPVAIRIGFHTGPVLRDEGDVFGDAVNLAARIASQAKAGQILTTATTVSELSAVSRASTRAIDRTTVRGKRTQVEIHEVVWQEDKSRAWRP